MRIETGGNPTRNRPFRVDDTMIPTLFSYLSHITSSTVSSIEEVFRSTTMSEKESKTIQYQDDEEEFDDW